MHSATKSTLKTVESSCNCCGSQRHKLYTTGQEHEYDNTTDEVFNVVECQDCGLIFLNPRPDVSELSTIYPVNYYSYGQQRLKASANPNSVLHRLRYKGFKAKVLKSLALAPDHSPVTMLDIGCGDGHTLNIYKQEAGKAVETHGVDFNADAVKMAQAEGHQGYCGRFEDVALPSAYFDLVTATHVIEHVADPKAFVEKVYQVLRSGGIFWFETPNIGSLDAKLFKHHHWGAYHFPRHWYFFDVHSIKKLAQLTGFEIEIIDFYPNAIFWFWTFHSMIVRANPKLRKLADWLFPAIDFQRDTMANFLRICFFCGIDVVIKLLTKQTSNMVVVFRKP
jgi:2-polyprenyl-3-methyl-5-hydroxy-6-metoxy-1,4-benzoquinol methylase